MRNKLLIALLLLASFQTMATLTGAAVASSSKRVKAGSTNTGFMKLPDELVDLTFQQCSAGAQKALRAVNRNCANIHRQMTEGRSVIIDMNTVSSLTQQERPVSELYAWLSQAHIIEIRNATAAIFPALLPHMAQVRQLTIKIHWSELGPNRLQIIQSIAQSPHMANLTTLDLSYNQFGDAEAIAIAQSPHMAKLTTLNLRNNQISGAGATAIAQSPHLSKLTTLDLGYNQIGDAGATAIAQSPHLSKLTTLILEYNQIGDAGATAIAQSPHLNKLKTLILEYNQIGHAGATAIAQSPHLNKLKTLYLSGNSIDGAVKATIRQRFPFALL